MSKKTVKHKQYYNFLYKILQEKRTVIKQSFSHLAFMGYTVMDIICSGIPKDIMICTAGSIIIFITDSGINVIFPFILWSTIRIFLSPSFAVYNMEKFLR